jgi:hypothetical protein
MRLSSLYVSAIALLALPAMAFGQSSKPWLNDPYTFPDVPKKHQNYDAIKYLTAYQIVQGYPDGTFKPDQGITRAEFTKVIVGALFSKTDIDYCLSRSGQPFPDTGLDEWFTPYVCTAKERGIVGGDGNGKFRPGDLLNVAESARILASAFNVPSLFSYDPKSPDFTWYRASVEALAARKALPVTLHDFSAPVLRGEIAEMTYRLKEGVTQKQTLSYEDLVRTTAEIHGEDVAEPVENGGVNTPPPEEKPDPLLAKIDQFMLNLNNTPEEYRCDLMRRAIGDCASGTQKESHEAALKLFEAAECDGDIYLSARDRELFDVYLQYDAENNPECKLTYGALYSLTPGVALWHPDYKLWREKIVKSVGLVCPALPMPPELTDEQKRNAARLCLAEEYIPPSAE